MKPLDQPVHKQLESNPASLDRDSEGTSPPIRVQLLHVADCPNLGELRRTVEQTIARLGVRAVIEEVEGPYPSPTLLVNGDDVTGRPVGSEPSCRLDTPTREQIIAAITRVAAKTEPIRSATTAASSLGGKEHIS